MPRYILRQFHYHLAHILPLEKAEERTHRLVDSFHHCLFALQLAGLEISTHFFSELSLTIQPIKNHQTLHRQPFGYHVKEVGRTWNRAFRVITGDAATGDDLIAPKVGGAKLADGSILAVNGQLAGTPSVLFDAIAVILSDEGAKTLSMESAAIDFVRDAFGHLKAIAVDKGGRALLKIANVGQDAGVVDASDKDAFIAAAKTRQWDREKSVRTLA